MDGWVDGWMGGWVDGWMGGWVDGWVGGWVGGWMGGWVDGCKVVVFRRPTYIFVLLHSLMSFSSYFKI